MSAGFIGEFMGTMVLVLMGNGAVANTLLRRSKAEGAGWVAITAGWGFGVTFGVFIAVACGSHEAHLNPAVTLGMAIASGDFSKLLVYAPAQLLGAMAGALLVWLHFLPHWSVTEDPGLKLACFATGPAIRSYGPNLLCEIIGTAVLVLGANAIFSKKLGADPAPGLGPYLVGALVWGIGLSLGGTTGYAINPARDLGPRIAHAVLPISKKAGSDWGYAPVPVIGPLIGAAIAGGLVRVLHI